MKNKLAPKHHRRCRESFTNLMVDKKTFIAVFKKTRKTLLKNYQVAIVPAFKGRRSRHTVNFVSPSPFYNIKLRTYYPVGNRFAAAKILIQKFVENLKVDGDKSTDVSMEDLSDISDSESEHHKDLLNSSQDTIILLNDTEDKKDVVEIIDLSEDEAENTIINLVDESQDALVDKKEDNKDDSSVKESTSDILNSNTLPLSPIICDGRLDLHKTPGFKRKLPVYIDLCDSQDEEPKSKRKKFGHIINSSEIIDLVDSPPTNNNINKRNRNKRKSNPVHISKQSVVTSTPIAKSSSRFNNENTNTAGPVLNTRKIETITKIPKFNPVQEYVPRTALIQKLLPSANSATISQPNNVVPEKSHTSKVGYNIYNPNTNKVSTGLRPIIIDGSNVAVQHGIATGSKQFSVAGLEICIEYFEKRGHSVNAFIPQFRLQSQNSNNHRRLQQLQNQGKVICTPSRKVNGRTICSYDDRYIVQTAAEFGGIIVSNDNYRDLMEENDAWRDTIEKRLLMFTWVGDCLMFPLDPLGRCGPSLDRFLRF